MEKEISTTLLVKDGMLRVKAFRSDFDGDGQNWKMAFYELWRLQMGYGYAEEIKVHEVHDGDVCVSLLIRKAYKDCLLDSMKDLGYRNITVSEEHLGVISIYDIDDPITEDMFTVVAD